MKTIANAIQRDDGLYYNESMDLFSNYALSYYLDHDNLMRVYKELSLNHKVKIVSIHIEVWIP